MAKEKTAADQQVNEKKAGDKALREEKAARKPQAVPPGKVRRSGRPAQPVLRKDPTKALFEAAQRLAKQVGVDAVFVHTQTLRGNPSLLQTFHGGPDVVLVVKGEEDGRTYRGLTKKVVRVPDVNLGRMDQVKLAVVMGITDRVITIGDRILCLVGRVTRHTADTMVVLDVGDEFETMNIHEQSPGTQEVDPKVFEATLTMALELANEGRDGRPIGAIFVLGGFQEVLRYSRQMIINPFQGHPESTRNILDPSLRETVKGFSSLDGAIVIRKDGVLVAAGRHLNAAYNGDALPPGLGARHAAAAAITAVTKSLALTVSESTGTVTVFRGGKVMMALERFRQAPSLAESQD
ncbi:MAG: DNA integrity scanning protein DisA nucleotide-binding domain protein [Nitrospinota bacterium]